MGSRATGFTLLELLLAVLVFAMVLGAVHLVFFSAFRLRARTTEALERSLPLQQTLAIIKRDLANLVPPAGLLSGPLQSMPTLTSGTSFTSVPGGLARQSGPRFYTAVGLVDDTAPWGEIQAVSYFLAPPTNQTPGLDLYRSVTRNLLPVLQEQTEDQYLMSGVQALAFQFYDGASWRDTWDSTAVDSATGLTNNLPRAIKLSLWLYRESSAPGTPAPVELVVPVMVEARSDTALELEGEMP